MNKKTLTSIFWVLMSVVLFADDSFANSLKLDVKEHVLKNGLKLLMLEKRDVPIVCVRINYKVGSVDERARALELAERAVSSDSSSATALLALSYAQQARFDLRGARQSVERATQVAPKNALAWARLAELWASIGRLDKAFEAAREAAAIDPDLALTQTVLGFAELSRVDIEAAKAAIAAAKG